MSTMKSLRSAVKEELAAAGDEMIDVLDKSQAEQGGDDIVEEFVKERLAAAAQEIMVRIETAIREYEQKLESYRELDKYRSED